MSAKKRKLSEIAVSSEVDSLVKSKKVQDKTDFNKIDILKSNVPVLKKKDIRNIVKNEYMYISNLFSILEVAKLNHGKRNLSEDEDDEVLDIPEKKVFKKGSSKKGSAKVSTKVKPFPQTIDGLEKELLELKGTEMTYQKKLRKKGLQSRLNKKKRKEDIKQQKALQKQGKQGGLPFNGPMKSIKPVLNSSGNVVSNKFDFADREPKKETKQKLGVTSEINFNQKSPKNTNSVNSLFNANSKNTSLSTSSIDHSNNLNSQRLENVQVSSNLLKNNMNERKKLSDSSIETVVEKKVKVYVPSEGDFKQEEKTATLGQGNIFNRDNKLVFSKVYLPESTSKKHKKKTVKDPKKLLSQLEENKKKISQLEKEDKEKAVTFKEKQKWVAALKRASGEKVRDDPELLKKTIAKDKNKKMRSQKKWQARIDRVQKEKDDRQKKRTENIQARKNDKKKRKMKKAIKKGSFVQV